MRNTAVPIATLAFGLIRVAAAAPPDDARGLEFYEKRIRPLLAARCYACHSVKSKLTQGGLALDSAAAWRKGGGRGPAISPGYPAKSLLIRAVHYSSDAPKMPPSEKLTTREIGDLEAWVRLGAPGPRDTGPHKPIGMSVEAGRRHWAFLPLNRREPARVPGLPAAFANWNRSPIDRYVAGKLRANGLLPNPPADRRSLIRRAYFDLIGLPPTPREVDDFVADRSPKAWEKVVDRLLASPHYGERWGRHWLDLARFAESHGYEQDYDRPNAYWYRDFVIRALNEDMPFDTFVKWQLAGDEFAPDNPLALMATGFLAAGTHATQITKNQVEKERYDELDDMLSVTCTSMLGLTMGCARCHDHKYDPLPMRDYYRMLSTFTTTVRSDFDVDMDPDGYRRAKAAFDAEHAPLVERLRRFEREEIPARMDAWLRSPSVAIMRRSWAVPELVKAESAGGATLNAQPDGSVLATGKLPDTDTITLTLRTGGALIRSLRVEALSDPSLPHGGPGRAANGNFALSDLKVTYAPTGKNARIVKLANPHADFEQKGLPAAAAVDGDAKSAWAVDGQIGRDHRAIFTLEPAAASPGGGTLTVTLKFENNAGHSIGRLRVAIQADGLASDSASAIPEAVLSALGHAPNVSQSERAVLLPWYRTIDPEWQKLNAPVITHLAREPKPDLRKVLISSEGVPAVRTHTQGGDFLEHTWFLKRGDPNQKGEVMSQGFMQVLERAPEGERRWQTPPPKGWRTSYQRHALARWMTDVDKGAGALLARVIVNRLWQHHFGRGIVATPSDFGTQGERPTHPELLDWLASELIHPARLTPAPSPPNAGGLARLPLAPLPPNAGGSRAGFRSSDVEGGGRLALDGGRGGCLHQVSTTGDRRAPRTSRIEYPKPRTEYPRAWSLKRLHRLILLSEAYRQSAAINPAAARKDPANRLVWRHSRQRLEAESIRDSMLAVSGELDPRMFGPGTLDESMKRRSIYFFVKRSKLIPTMMLFDAPNSLQSLPARAATTIAPQALMLMNNSHVEEWARAFAQRIAPTGTPLSQAVDQGYRLAVGRLPTPKERADSLAFITAQAAGYATGPAAARGVHPAAARQPAMANPGPVVTAGIRPAGARSSNILEEARNRALTDFCQVLFSLNEFIFID